MPRTITAEFDTRRDAETAIEHLVQEHGIDRNAVTVGAASQENTAGTKPAGGDLVDSLDRPETEGEPALEGRVAVAVKVDNEDLHKLTTTFNTYGGRSPGS